MCTPEAPFCQVCFSLLAVQVEEIAAAGRLDGHPPVNMPSLSIEAVRSRTCTSDLSEVFVKHPVANVYDEESSVLMFVCLVQCITMSARWLQSIC